MGTQSHLRRFMQMIGDVQRKHPCTQMILPVPKNGLVDWYRLKESDWKEAGWEGEDENLTSMFSEGDDFLKALKLRLARVGVTGIEVTEHGADMEVVPASRSEITGPPQ